MNIDYTYIKKRARFGRQCMFSDEGPTVVDNLFTNYNVMRRYILRGLVNRGTQKGDLQSAHEINTWRSDYADRGMFHEEGGWPKDINLTNEEAVLRYRKKVLREQNFIDSMLNLTKPIEHAILQNNSVNIYEKYHDTTIKKYSSNESSTRMRTDYRDPSKCYRPVSYVSWPHQNCESFAVTYCHNEMEEFISYGNTEAFIWDVERPNSPQITFDSNIPIISLEWNLNNNNPLVGGLLTGQIALYDLRKPSYHVGITSSFFSHREPAHSVYWIHSKTGMDFFSTSSDGYVKWWDARNLKQFTDYILLDPSRLGNPKESFLASALEYDINVPAKYLVGTENGYVLCGNRKGNTINEKLPWIMKTHSGRIKSLRRNPAFSKFFLTVADWNCKIWSEDCKESAIYSTKNYKPDLTCGEWSQSRYSVFLLARADGRLDLWDLLQDQKEPTVSVLVSFYPLTALKIEDQGQFLVVGDEKGKCFLIQLSESLSSCEKNDKFLLNLIFERESRREKIYENKMKELKLALRLKAMQETDVPEDKKSVISQIKEDIVKAEENYWEEVRKIICSSRKSISEKFYAKSYVESRMETLKATGSIGQGSSVFRTEEEQAVDFDTLSLQG